MRNSTIEVAPVSGGLGAEIHGVDLAKPQDDRVYADMRAALNEHGVIFFHDQPLTSEQYVAFGEHFGELRAHDHPTIQNTAHPKIQEIRKEPHERDNIGEGWHADQSGSPHPSMGTILLARELPPHGGDTLFISMTRAFETLSPGLQRTLEGLKAVHGVQTRLSDTEDPQSRRYIKPEKRTADVVHPVVHVHPENGRKVLYVNPVYTHRFDGWTREESAPLLNLVYQHAQKPEFGCRFRYRVGSIAFWDNRQVWHYAANDYHGYRRVMHRLCVR